MAWRLTPADFRLAGTHGVPEGSSLADWPLDYAALEPFYTRVEQEIGVSGDGAAHRNQGRRSRGYPMPPLPDNTEARLLRAGAAALGVTTGPVPMLINSVPRDGRGQCGQCGECVGFACPTDAKNGPYNTVLPSLFDEPVIDGPGPNVRIATCDYVNNLPGVIGGGVLANEIVKLPILHWARALPPDAPRWGLPGKQTMRQLYRRTAHVFGPIQETPSPQVRLTLDPSRTDRHGVPLIRLSGEHHPESVRAPLAQRQKALDWLEASGASANRCSCPWVRGPSPPPGRTSRGAGRCRPAARRRSVQCPRWPASWRSGPLR
jgi:choline dehydrogenase-like flavoprotein